jgi:hypothetical protein
LGFDLTVHGLSTFKREFYSAVSADVKGCCNISLRKQGVQRGVALIIFLMKVIFANREIMLGYKNATECTL